MNSTYEIGTYFKVVNPNSVYFGMIGKFVYEICGQMMINFENGDGRAYTEDELQWVA